MRLRGCCGCCDTLLKAFCSSQTVDTFCLLQDTGTKTTSEHRVSVFFPRQSIHLFQLLTLQNGLCKGVSSAKELEFLTCLRALARSVEGMVRSQLTTLLRNRT